jgi:hypothetical protein
MPDGYDKGIFDCVDRFAEALDGRPFADLPKARQKTLIDRF